MASIYEEMKIEDLEHTLNRLEDGLEVAKRRAEKAEQALARSQQAANDEDEDDDDSQEQDDDEEEEDAAPSSQLKRSQPALELNYKKGQKMKKQYEPTAGNGQISAAAMCTNCGGKGHTRQDCPSDSTGNGGDNTKRRVGKIVAKASERNATVAKCLANISKGSSGNRSNYDAALELLAEKVARKIGISKAAAYGEVLSTDEGAQIYAGYCAARVGTAPLPESYMDEEREAIAKARPGPPVMVDSEAPGAVLSRIEKGERVSKSSLEAALDSLATKFQAQTGQSFYKCYTDVITKSEPGQAIYRAYDEMTRNGS